MTSDNVSLVIQLSQVCIKPCFFGTSVTDMHDNKKAILQHKSDYNTLHFGANDDLGH